MYSLLLKLWVLELKPQQPALFWGKETVSLTISQLELEPAIQVTLLSSCCALHIHKVSKWARTGDILSLHFRDGEASSRVAT